MSSFQLPKLSYDYDELEPYVDSNTLSIHHGKHPATYLKYQNRRPGFVANWWHTVNWDQVNESLQAIQSQKH
ncbi:Fe-Mn family superoxide dismutase [Bacillus cereus]|uniref:superoxide dismutase n=1 Tax=Bacillus cereus TaxID=1396 RepID=A0A2A7I3G6_BACCE|nr:Fe-Mn family superoxide dismutase [Bacillus cereus]PEC23583.1 hypothetical protein COM96_02485 [Bacillus cereus]